MTTKGSDVKMTDHNEPIYTAAVKGGRAEQRGEYTLFIFPNLRAARVATLAMARDPDLFPLNGSTALAIGADQPFTKSNGTILARIYERLTRASRRSQARRRTGKLWERAYRKGVYDAFKALQDELT